MSINLGRETALLVTKLEKNRVGAVVNRYVDEARQLRLIISHITSSKMKIITLDSLNSEYNGMIIGRRQVKARKKTLLDVFL